MNGRVAIDVEDQVAHVRLVRADKMNALDPAMFDALAEAGATLRSRRDVRAVVLSGDGRAFCAGLDVRNFQTMAGGGAVMDLVPRTHGPANLVQHVALQWRDMAVPVTAAVHGIAFGGGFQLMLGADMRFVHPQTQLSVMEIKWGLVPDMGGTWLMRGLVRPDVAADLIYTGRIFDGREGHELGLVTRLCDEPRQAALSVAREIAQKSPDAIRAAKRLLNLGDSAMGECILKAEAAEQTLILGASNQVEAVRAAQERRSALFTD